MLTYTTSSREVHSVAPAAAYAESWSAASVAVTVLAQAPVLLLLLLTHGWKRWLEGEGCCHQKVES